MLEPVKHTVYSDSPAPVLYPRQRQVLKYIEKFIAEKGYSPTLTDIKDHLGVKALSTVHEHLIKLEEKGFLERCDDDKSIKLKMTRGQYTGSIINVPLVGMITAGEPIDAIEEADQDNIPLPAELIGNKRVFCLKVKGDSMIESLISDGDVVVCEKVDLVENGDTIVALLDDNTATLKKFYKEKNCIRLQPANPKYEPLEVQNVTIQGRVIAIYRKFEQ
jgi:repressor LexA